MLKTCMPSVMAILLLLVALDGSNYANAQSSISNPAMHKPDRRSNFPFLSKRGRERHFRRQNVKTDWDYIVPPVSPDPRPPRRAPGRAPPPPPPRPRTSPPSANSNANSSANSAISVASRTPGPSSSLSNQSNRSTVEAQKDEPTPAKPKGISPIQIRPAILDLSMPFALVCLSLVLVLAFLVSRGSAAVSKDVRQILLTRSTSYKAMHP